MLRLFVNMVVSILSVLVITTMEGSSPTSMARDDAPLPTNDPKRNSHLEKISVHTSVVEVGSEKVVLRHPLVQAKVFCISCQKASLPLVKAGGMLRYGGARALGSLPALPPGQIQHAGTELLPRCQ